MKYFLTTSFLLLLNTHLVHCQIFERNNSEIFLDNFFPFKLEKLFNDSNISQIIIDEYYPTWHPRKLRSTETVIYKNNVRSLIISNSNFIFNNEVDTIILNSQTTNPNLFHFTYDNNYSNRFIGNIKTITSPYGKFEFIQKTKDSYHEIIYKRVDSVKFEVQAFSQFFHNENFNYSQIIQQSKYTTFILTLEYSENAVWIYGYYFDNTRKKIKKRINKPQKIKRIKHLQYPNFLYQVKLKN